MAKKITDEQKELVKALRQTGESYKKCGEKAGISESAARKIVMENSPQTEAEKSAESLGKERFVENAWSIINGSIELIKDRLHMAQADVSNLMEIIDDVIAERDLDDKAKNKLVFMLEKQARELTVPGLKELSNVIETMYDKQALMTGNATQKISFTDDLSLENLAEVAGYVKKE